MPTIEVHVRRFSVVSSKPFEEIISALTATIGHPDMNAFRGAVAAARKVGDLKEVVQGAIGSSDLMEFARLDAAGVLRKEQCGQGPRILRLLVGNPLIMKEMAKTVPDAASYAPITILVDERADGVHLSYDSMASVIAPYGSQAALVVARDLDAKVENLLKTVAQWLTENAEFVRADTLHAGDGSLVPPRTPRTALDVRPQLDRMLSAHIVEAGQPLATLAD